MNVCQQKCAKAPPNNRIDVSIQQKLKQNSTLPSENWRKLPRFSFRESCEVGERNRFNSNFNSTDEVKK